MENETLGQRIRRLRELRRWGQRELADLLGVSVKTISNWERDRNDPRSSMGALREIFGSALDGAEVLAGDPVEVAVRQSPLVDWRQDAVLSTYKRNLYEQRGEVAG